MADVNAKIEIKKNESIWFAVVFRLYGEPVNEQINSSAFWICSFEIFNEIGNNKIFTTHKVQLWYKYTNYVSEEWNEKKFQRMENYSCRTKEFIFQSETETDSHRPIYLTDNWNNSEEKKHREYKQKSFMFICLWIKFVKHTCLLTLMDHFTCAREKESEKYE